MPLVENKKNLIIKRREVDFKIDFLYCVQLEIGNLIDRHEVVMIYKRQYLIKHVIIFSKLFFRCGLCDRSLSSGAVWSVGLLVC